MTAKSSTLTALCVNLPSGSVEAIPDDQGQLLERYRYTPFGKRITVSGNDDATTRGFTAHEELKGLGLIHMNARVYDPLLQRFLAADTYVQAPLDGQSFNRYAYVRNNPQKYTDPTGHFLNKVKKELGRLDSSLRAELRRIERDVRHEFERLCDDGCEWRSSTDEDGNVTHSVSINSGSNSNGDEHEVTVGVSIAFTEDGVEYSSYVGYGGFNFGYSTGGGYSGGELYAENRQGQRFSIYGFTASPVQLGDGATMIPGRFGRGAITRQQGLKIKLGAEITSEEFLGGESTIYTNGRGGVGIFIAGHDQLALYAEGVYWHEYNHVDFYISGSVNGAELIANATTKRQILFDGNAGVAFALSEIAGHSAAGRYFHALKNKYAASFKFREIYDDHMHTETTKANAYINSVREVWGLRVYPINSRVEDPGKIRRLSLPHEY